MYRNASDPASTLQKKAAIAVTRQSVAAGIMTVFKENTETNLSATK